VFHARFILITYTPQTLDIQHAVNSTAWSLCTTRLFLFF
jgi:hypothetical protein